MAQNIRCLTNHWVGNTTKQHVGSPPPPKDDGDDGGTVRTLVADPDMNEDIVEIECEGTIVKVSRIAKETLCSAVDALANQLTIFYRCMHSVRAVTDILGRSLISRLFLSADKRRDWSV